MWADSDGCGWMGVNGAAWRWMAVGGGRWGRVESDEGWMGVDGSGWGWTAAKLPFDLPMVPPGDHGEVA
jgi:hypothetical protein